MSELIAGRYRLLERLGAGGMAVVWRAEDEHLHRVVALKMIAEHLSQNPDYVARFEREARIAASLSHPNLVRVWDYAVIPSEDDQLGRPALIMEYIEGQTLEDDPFAIEPEPLAEQVLSALAHIHQAGIVHRDIKPANILVDHIGQARLTDFGIAHFPEATRLTQTGQIIGTIRFLAPEIAHGEMATSRSDLYAAGVLFDVHAAHGERMTPALEALIFELCATDPLQRPNSAEEALIRLDQLRQLQPTELATLVQAPGIHPQPTVTDSLPEEVEDEESRPAWILGALAVLALIIVLALVIWQGNQEESSGDQLPRVPDKQTPLQEQLERLDRAVDAAGRDQD